MAELAKKRKERAGHRASKTRLITSINAELSASPMDEEKIAQLRMSLDEKLKTLQVIDDRHSWNDFRRSNR